MSKGKRIISISTVALVACLRGEMRLKKFPSDAKILDVRMDFERVSDIVLLRVESEHFKSMPPFTTLTNELRGTTRTGGVSCEE